MIKAIWDEGFKRRYRKRVKKNEELKRKFRRVVFEFIGEDRVLLIDVGRLNEVY